MAEMTGMEKYAALIVLVAAKEGVTHIRIKPAGTAAVIEHWRDGGWHEADLTDRAEPMHQQLMRRFADASGHPVPPPDSLLTGRFALEKADGSRIYVLVAIDHDFELAAYLELVNAATYEACPAPRPPA